MSAFDPPANVYTHARVQYLATCPAGGHDARWIGEAVGPRLRLTVVCPTCDPNVTNR